MEQVDILWHCLVEDSECYDDALHWFLNQVRSKDQHAMGMETYKHLFLEKVILFLDIFFFLSFLFLETCLWHMEVPRLEVKSEL